MHVSATKKLLIITLSVLSISWPVPGCSAGEPGSESPSIGDQLSAEPSTNQPPAESSSTEEESLSACPIDSNNNNNNNDSDINNNDVEITGKLDGEEKILEQWCVASRRSIAFALNQVKGITNLTSNYFAGSLDKDFNEDGTILANGIMDRIRYFAEGMFVKDRLDRHSKGIAAQSVQSFCYRIIAVHKYIDSSLESSKRTIISNLHCNYGIQRYLKQKNAKNINCRATLKSAHLRDHCLTIVKRHKKYQ